MPTTQQRVLFRYLNLPRRQSRAANPPPPGPDFPPLQELIDQAWTAMPTVGQRHVPALRGTGNQALRPEDGKRYVVPIRRQVHRGTGAVVLRLCVYTGGEVAGFAPRALNQAEASIEYANVTDDDGETLAPGVEFSVLLLGRLALIQNRAGAGAAAAVQNLVHDFGRRLHGSAFVRPTFVPVAPRDLKDQIEQAGGIAALSFGVVEVNSDANGAVHLSDVHRIEDRLGGERTRVRVTAPSDGTLDTDESLKLLESPGEEGLEDVKLHLRDNGILSGDRVVLGKSVSVELENGVPSCNHVDRELLGYLAHLMRVDHTGHQAVNADGLIGDKLQLVTVHKKRR